MINKQKIYVAGPYTNGDTVLNIRDAIMAGDTLFYYGFIPFIPHLTGFWHLLCPNTYEAWMDYDAEWLKSCNAVLRLLGESAGADREMKMADELGIPIFYGIPSLVAHFTKEEK